MLIGHTFLKQLIVAIGMCAPLFVLGESNRFLLDNLITSVDIQDKENNSFSSLINRPELFTVGVDNVKVNGRPDGLTDLEFDVISIKPNPLWYSDITNALSRDSDPVVYEQASLGKRFIVGVVGLVPLISAALVYGQSLFNKIKEQPSDDICVEGTSNATLICYKSTRIEELNNLLGAVMLEASVVHQDKVVHQNAVGLGRVSMIDRYVADVPFDGELMSKRSEFLVLRPSNLPQRMKVTLRKEATPVGSELRVNVKFPNKN